MPHLLIPTWSRDIPSLWFAEEEKTPTHLQPGTSLQAELELQVLRLMLALAWLGGAQGWKDKGKGI